MITPAQRAEIRRLYFGEHWKIGTIAAALGDRARRPPVSGGTGGESASSPHALARRVPAGPGSQWPPPSLRLVWPVRLSVVVTWRRPNLVVPRRCPLPSTGSRSIPPLRRYYETLRLLAAHPPALPFARRSIRVRFAPSDARCDVHGLGLGEPAPAPRRSLRETTRPPGFPGNPPARMPRPRRRHGLVLPSNGEPSAFRGSISSLRSL